MTLTPETTRTLSPQHRKTLHASALSDDVIAERGYFSVADDGTDADPTFDQLREYGVPMWARDVAAKRTGLLIPQYGPTGDAAGYQYRPDRSPTVDGKVRKYAAPKGRASVLDVHPRNTRAIKDPSIALWITEGVKKSDALTTAGACAIALSGVYNWRSTHGTLGEWEDVALKGRDVYVCFDSDAAVNPHVAKAMARLGKWLKSKGVGKVRYVVTPYELGGITHNDPTTGQPMHLPGTPIGDGKVGADDYLAAGGTLDDLTAVATTTPPELITVDSAFTDARMAETIAEDVLEGRYCYTGGLGWFRWDGHIWANVMEEVVLDEVRRYCLDKFKTAIDERNKDAIDGWHSITQTAARMRSILALARGVEGIIRDAADFDAHPDLLNTPSGVVDLTTGDLQPHDPELLLTKSTGVGYVPGATHVDWEQALNALPANVRPYMQLRYGQAITGHMTPDDLLVVQQGGGENGKTTLTTGVQRCLKDYYLLLSDRVLLANPTDHPTELMDLRGVRLGMIEETPEARRLNTQRLKKTVGTEQITARHIRRDDVTFDATHSLFLSTNYRPVVEETEHGVWRRLLLVTYPFTFRKPGRECVGPWDRPGDPALRQRLKEGHGGRAEAVLAWLVAGAVEWYARDKVMPEPPAEVEADTRAWRRESDLVIGYFDDRLVLDRDCHVLSADMLADLNRWLEDHGHRPWSDKLMTSRFASHDVLRGHHVEKRQVRAYSVGKQPSRPAVDRFHTRKQVPARYQAWLGLRFRTDADDDAQDYPVSFDDAAVRG